MRTVYIDSESKCHTVNDGTMREVENSFFDGRCDAFIEGYCYDDSHGYIQVYPWRSYNELKAAQAQYEKDLAERAELEAAYNYLLTGGMRNE
jgi:hypothetical protein